MRSRARLLFVKIWRCNVYCTRRKIHLRQTMFCSSWTGDKVCLAFEITRVDDERVMSRSKINRRIKDRREAIETVQSAVNDDRCCDLRGW